MNPLQEHAHLFANEKFKANTKYSINHKILGIIQDDNSLILKDDVEDEIFYEYANNCTLIARPIEDMTESEIVEFEGSLINIDPQDAIEVITENDRKKTWGMLKLLSIGVYPFDQSHFDDGTVIRSTDIDQHTN